MLLSLRKPLAALAALTAALAVAVPVASANTVTTRAPSVDPTVCQLLTVSEGPFGPGMFIGGASLTNTLVTAGNSVGCTPPAPQHGLLPIAPLLP